jgi:hypothetical protein
MRICRILLVVFLLATRAHAQTFDVGIIAPAPGQCPAGSEYIEIRLDSEDDNNDNQTSGWTGAIRKDTQGTGMIFGICRVNGLDFGPQCVKYGVLRLSGNEAGSCPNGGVDRAWKFYLETDEPQNTWTMGDVKPSRIDTDHDGNDKWLVLRLCIFPEADAFKPLPRYGQPYGVFAAFNPAFWLAPGHVHTDDEDDSTEWMGVPSGSGPEPMITPADSHAYLYDGLFELSPDGNENTDISVVLARNDECLENSCRNTGPCQFVPLLSFPTAYQFVAERECCRNGKWTSETVSCDGPVVYTDVTTYSRREVANEDGSDPRWQFRSTGFDFGIGFPAFSTTSFNIRPRLELGWARASATLGQSAVTSFDGSGNLGSFRAAALFTRQRSPFSFEAGARYRTLLDSPTNHRELPSLGFATTTLDYRSIDMDAGLRYSTPSSRFSPTVGFRATQAEATVAVEAEGRAFDLRRELDKRQFVAGVDVGLTPRLAGRAEVASDGHDPEISIALRYHFRPLLLGPASPQEQTTTKTEPEKKCPPKPSPPERGLVLHVVPLTIDNSLLHTIRFDAAFTWAGFNDVRGPAGDPGEIVDVGTAVVQKELHVVVVNAKGQILHAIRHPDKWQGFLEVTLPGAPSAGKFVKVAAAEIGNKLHLVAVHEALDGATRVFHTIRHPDKWDAFGDVEQHTGSPGKVVSIDCAGVGGQLHIVVANDEGTVSHSIRLDPGWSTFGALPIKDAQGDVKEVSCAAVLGELHVAVITNSGGLFHTIRHAASWDGFGDVRTVAANSPSAFADVAVADQGGRLHIVAVTWDGGLFHTIRLLPGWSPFGNIELTNAGEGGVFRRVSADGVDMQ